MEISVKNITPSVLSHHGEFAPIQIIKSAGGVPLFINMKMIEDLGRIYFRPTRKQKEHFAIYECPYCGNLFKARTYQVNSGKTKDCGCKRYENHCIHGMSKTLIFRQWNSLLSRINNPNVANYINYGGRGITMCPSWNTDFKSYYDYVSKLPHFGEKGYTIDRINNDGNYEPGNVRWTTRHIQAVNQRKLKKNNSTGFVGVHYREERSSPWIAMIGVNKKQINIGHFKTKIEAVIARNNYIIANNLTEYKLNKVD